MTDLIRKLDKLLTSPIGEVAEYVRGDDDMAWQFLATIIHDAQRRRKPK